MIAQLIQRASNQPGCSVLRPHGLPNVAAQHIIPPDVIEFYELCGGIELYVDSDYPYRFVRPDEVVRANPVIVGDLCPDDISSDWYVLVEYSPSEYLTIDFNIGRFGRCYDSFHETHGLVGETPVIALSLADLLTRILENRGQRYFWLNDDFSSLGDAYDSLAEC